MLRIVLLAALALVVAVSSHASSLAPSVLFTAVRDGVLTVRTFDAEGAPIGTVSAIAVATERFVYGFRRSFASLCDWVEMPAGIAAQIQGHKPSALREKHYIRRELDLLRMWHAKLEVWILEQAGIEFIPTQAGLQVVK